ncbi:hypothetical protein IWW36_001130 [Coemansia brasiliensis]|uniref:PH domain-containing protein n=1 Tax=Coemansia brasiliensis TaxID=2650707 RepID=A0A9W8IIA1_9FUNG|nr:hypothetical protein IWW36_001130 [Coemansia brasiliensis]
MTTLAVAAKETADTNKQQQDSSRPVSTSSGTSIVSTVDTSGGISTTAKAKLAESLGSLSTMPTPRNTFLTPPTGLNLADKGAFISKSAGATEQQVRLSWDSQQHQVQLQKLVEAKDTQCTGSSNDKRADTKDEKRQHQERPQAAHLVSYDDNYCLLNHPSALTDGPYTREAAVEQLRRLAGRTDALSNSRAKEENRWAAETPLVLAPAVEGLSELESALAGIVARRQIPNRTHVYRQAKGGAGSLPTAASATAGGSAASPGAAKPARRKQRLSMMSAGQESVSGGGADDKRSMRSRASVISSDIVSSTLGGTTPYVDLNGHIERLATCISRLQPAALESTKAGPGSHGHGRQSSFGGSIAKSAAASVHSLVAMPLTSDNMPPLPAHDDQSAHSLHAARLTPVAESPVVGERGKDNEPIRSRSSSHLSVMSGGSTESRRRIMVGEALMASQFPSLFGSPVAETGRSPNMAVPSAGSTHSGSIYSHDSSDSRSQSANGTGLESARAASIISRTKGSGSPMLNAPAVTVRDITPAGRLALWVQLHTTVEIPKPSLWRRKQWHRRFMIFAGNVLYLFKSSSPAATALTMVRLSTQTIVCVNDSFHNRNWVVEITQPAGDVLNATALAPQSWFVQLDVRSEMIVLLKQLKAVIGELQVQPDLERKEEERLRDRKRRQRDEALQKADVCPWEADEFSDASTGSDAGETRNGSIAAVDGLHRIADDELFSSSDESPMTATDSAGTRAARPAKLQINRYTGTGGIAEWGAHRLHVPYSPASSTGMHPPKMRSFSADPAAVTGRRPSLADVLAPPGSAIQELTPVPAYSPQTSPQTPPQTTGARGSVMIRADASELIDQMFASASRELAAPSTLSSVREEQD